MRATTLVSLALLIASLVAGCQSAAMQRVQAGKALYEEKCRTVAGEKIYRTVEGVEGVLLIKVRPTRGDAQLADPNWPGAAFGRESRGDEYISSFLEYENPVHAEHVKPGTKVRGHINKNPGPAAIPGYRYVDVIDPADGERYRYTGRWEEPWQYDKSYLKGLIKFFLDKTPSTLPAPRYGVTFQDHVIPEERALWVASSTVKVIDLESKEVLGEMLRYAWAGGGPTPASPSPWLRAWKCPAHEVGANAATRKFVDQVLIPSKEK